jgi:ribonuclease R
MLSEQEILRYIGKQPKHTAGFKQFIHDLGLKGRARRDLQELLKDMTRRRKLVAIGKERWSLPTSASTHNLVVGRLHTHRDGYGFVTPDPDSLPVRAQGKLQGDIFIPPPEIGNAMHGDRVLVELGSIRHDGRAEGRIVRVTEREQETVVGIFHYSPRHNYVTPIDAKVAVEIVIPQGMEYPREATEDEEEARPSAEERKRHPRNAFKASPHRVLGEGVKRGDWDDLENVVVEVEIVQWPSASQNPRGRVVEILGYEDDFGVDVEMVIRKHHIAHVFPPEVLEEAQEISPVIPAREIARRIDYRDLPIVTIDGETARDFDDAVLVRRLENGNYELHVHIADVAHYVEDGSAIDEEARKRGTSVYFPDRAVPMLPLELSTDICSLRPNVERLVNSCVMEIDPRGEIISYELAEGVIRSAERMTYTDVNAILEGDEHLRQRYAPQAENFDLMYELAQILNRKRVRRGSIDFDMPEPVIEFDERGMMKGVSRSERNWAHRLIEEFMLSANETVAGHLEQRVASIYRIHEKPDPKKIYEFENIAASFGYSLGVGALPVKRVQMRADKRARHGSGRSAPMIELPEEVHVTPRMYQKLIQKIAGKPEERILSYLMLRSLKQARYSEANEGHFALAAPSYTHFTSPIRRYPDLIVHRILKAVLRESGQEVDGSAVRHTPKVSAWSKNTEKTERKEKEKDDKTKRRPQRGPISEEELHDIAESSSRSERAADEAERELLEWKKLKFMQDRVGEDFDGLIMSITKFGFFVELEELFIEGLVPLASLTDDHYTFHENTRQIIGARNRKTFSIGDKVRVLVDRIDRMQRKIQFAILEEKPARPQKRHKKRG